MLSDAIRRQPVFHGLFLILPCSIIGGLILATFFLPPENAERLGLFLFTRICICVLLCFVWFSWLCLVVIICFFIVLYCIVLIQFSSVLFCSILFRLVLSCCVLQCSVLFSVLFCSVLFRFNLFCFNFVGML